MFNSQQFSKALKILKYDYLERKPVDGKTLSRFLSELESFDLNKLQSDYQKLAFWLNVYNGFTNYAIIHFELKNSMKEISDLFKRRFFCVNGLDFSLDDIEHGLLRRNARGHLVPDDARLAYQVNHVDYRIHFALNCGAQSCPALAFYSESQLEQELQEAERAFVTQEFIVDHMKKIINCSSLFEWYREDFGSSFLNDTQYAGFEVVLRDYDWSV